jgi:hypothetical protein
VLIKNLKTKKRFYCVTFWLKNLLKFISKSTFAEDEKEYNSLVVRRNDIGLCGFDCNANSMDYSSLGLKGKAIRPDGAS